MIPIVRLLNKIISGSKSVSVIIESSGLLGQESGRTKVPRIFGIFVPNFAPNFAPNFLRIFWEVFVLRVVGNGDQKKFTKNPRHVSMQNSQANTKKIFTNIFWRGGKVMDYQNPRSTLPKCFGNYFWLFRWRHHWNQIVWNSFGNLFVCVCNGTHARGVFAKLSSMKVHTWYYTSKPPRKLFEKRTFRVLPLNRRLVCTLLRALKTFESPSMLGVVLPTCRRSRCSCASEIVLHDLLMQLI